jgi:hypothetical protein
VPHTRVGTAFPFTFSAGPRPHRSRSGARGMPSRRTPGISRPEICSGPCCGVNVIVSLVVRMGANRTAPLGPTFAPRTWPPEPAMKTWSGPAEPGGRWIVIRRTVRGRRQPMVRMGCASVALAVQAVAGSPSNAARAWSCGLPVYVDDALIHTPARLVPRYLPAREAEISTAEPCSAARLVAPAVNAWPKPYCSSVGLTSAGLQTHRSQVGMHPDGHGWALASTTVPGAGCSAGATISRLARTPGTVISLMAA